jgi:4-amino-4-deoxy-L-arabinose transferase
MTQTVDRFATERFKRDEPVWFFPLLFAGTFLPYTFSLLRGVCRYREWSPQFRAQLLYLLLPLTVFCASKSKLPPYIVPFYGTAALMVVYVYQEFKSKWDDRVAFLFLVIMAAALGCGGFVSPRLEAVRLPLALSGGGVLLGVFALRRQFAPQRALPTVAGFLIAITMLVYLLMPLFEKQMKSYKELARQMNLLDPQRRVPNVVYKAFLPSLSFYRQKLAIMVEGSKSREIGFETDDAYKQWYIESLSEMNTKLAGEARLFLVTQPDSLAEFVNGSAFTCSELFVQKKHTLYDCRRKSIPLSPLSAGTALPP